jgi:CheY-like chemotaxis protein
MKQQILAVFGDRYQFDNTRNIFQEALLEDLGEIEVVWGKNADMAINRLHQKQYHLLITELNIPRDEGLAVIEEAREGIKLLKNIQNYGIPSLLVVPARTNELQDTVDELYQCRLVEKGCNYREKLLKYSRMFLGNARLEIAESELDKAGCIDLELDLHRDLWQFKIIGEFGDSEYQNEGMLEIRSDRIIDLISRSCNIKFIPNWESEMQQIGKTLCEEILENNRKFMKAFYKLTSKIDKQDKIRIRFKVDRKVHPVLLEAIIEEDSFLMLNSPVYRRLSVSGEYHLAYQPGNKRAPVNCLIIESGFKGKAPEIDPKIDFPKLNNIQWEANWLYNFLKDNRDEFNIGAVEWVRDTPERGSLIDSLQEALSRKPWELVHYAGHSYYAAGSGKGYLLFPPDGAPSVVRLQEFGKWLRDCETQLVFLSSCHSSEEEFVFELAANEIPSVIGFRWDIEDDKAYVCARQFYTHLFKEGRTLEYAFLETRRDMYREYPENRIWASPILIMQQK